VSLVTTWSRHASHRRIVSPIPAGFATGLNARAEGTPVFIASQGGVNLYAGHNSSATGRTLAIRELAGVRGSWADFVQASRDLAENALGRRLNSREVSDYWSRKAWEWIRSSPVGAARLTIKKASFLVNSYELPNVRRMDGCGRNWAPSSPRAVRPTRRSTHTGGIARSPDNPNAYNELGLLFQRAINADSAVAVWRRGVEQVLGDFTLHFNLALAYALQGNSEAALREVDQALRIAPADSTARALRAEIRGLAAEPREKNR
jgi:tetratricopeptide (TPR) repeat protein